MVAVSGIAFTEFLGLTDNALKAGTLDYNFPLAPLIATQAVVMGFVEITRLNGWQETGSVSPHHLLHLFGHNACLLDMKTEDWCRFVPSLAL